MEAAEETERLIRIRRRAHGRRGDREHRCRPQLFSRKKSKRAQRV